MISIERAQPVSLLLAPCGDGVLVDVAMVRDFVAAFEHGLDRLGVLLDAPGGHKECLFYAEMLVGLDNARHRDFGAVAMHGDG